MRSWYVGSGSIVLLIMDTVKLTWLDQNRQQHTATAKLATGPVG